MSVEIFDMNGRWLLARPVQKMEYTLKYPMDPGLTAGVYYIEVGLTERTLDDQIVVLGD